MNAYSSHCVGCGKVSVCLRSNLCPACLEGAYLAMRAELERIKAGAKKVEMYYPSDHATGYDFAQETSAGITKLLEKYPV